MWFEVEDGEEYIIHQMTFQIVTDETVLKCWGMHSK